MRNNKNGEGIFLVVPDTPPEALYARVPGIYRGYNEAALTLAPRSEFAGVGASRDDISSTLQWLIDADHPAFVRCVDQNGKGKMYPFEKEDIKAILNRDTPTGIAGLLVYTAYYHAKVREIMLESVQFSLEGYANNEWLESGVGPNPGETRGLLNQCSHLREKMAKAAKMIRETQRCLPSRKLAAIREILEEK
jgi:hypothetical protein